uniref:Uncharacterized protein n=1 Tax=Panagrolaimus sp. PS1159 TaxID=55785 RepID=A0AC35GDE9_9BILA
MPTINEEYLLDFPSITNISVENRRKFSQIAFMAFFCVEDDAVKAATIASYINKCSTYDPITEERKEINSSEFNVEMLNELLKLPEIACLIYGFRMTNRITKHSFQYYRSVFNSVKRGDRCKIYWFRTCIIICIEQALERNLGDKYGNIELQDLCDTFNQSFGSHCGWNLNLRDTFKFFGDKTFLFALCFYCSRELVISIPRYSSYFAKLRLRNHPIYLFNQINTENALAKNAVKVYNRYYEDNPDQILWIKLVPDIRYTDIRPNMSKNVSYPSTMIDKIYAAIYYSNKVKDFSSLIKACNVKTTSTTATVISNDESDVKILAQMLSPKSLMAVECWDLPEQNLFTQIIDNYIPTMNQIKQNSLFERIENLWISEFEYQSLNAMEL